MSKESREKGEELRSKEVKFWEAFWFWVRLGFINFGGPAGQIAIMHRELVERKHWVAEGQFLRTLNFCMLLPGPEAQQVATHIGWRLHGTLGGVARSEEHTSELQSRQYLVCRLLLEKKNLPSIALNSRT